VEPLFHCACVHCICAHRCPTSCHHQPTYKAQSTTAHQLYPPRPKRPPPSTLHKSITRLFSRSLDV
jgi:hypothetical protein